MNEATWYSVLIFVVFLGIVFFPSITFSKVDKLLGKEELDVTTTLRAPKSWTVHTIAPLHAVERFNAASKNINTMLQTLDPASPAYKIWQHKQYELERGVRWQRLVEASGGR